MKKHNLRLIRNNTVLKSAEAKTKNEFYPALYGFLLKIRVVKNKKEYFQFLFIHQKQIKSFLESNSFK